MTTQVPLFVIHVEKTYRNVLAFNEHVRRYHFKEFPCSQCDQKFTANIALKRHMRIHNKSSGHYPCDVLSLVLPKYIREKGMYYEFLCSKQAGECAHNRLSNAEKIFANIANEEQRYFKMLKYVKNQDKCDKTIFNSKIKFSLQIKNNDMY